MRMQAAHPFRLGDLVTWSSQAAGSWATKTGEDVEIVPPRRDPLQLIAGSPRNDVSYIVKVVEMGKRGPKKARYYWPITSKLAKAPKAKRK